MLKQYFENVETQHFFDIFFSSAGNSAGAPAGPHSSTKAGGAWSFISPTGGGAPARGKARKVGQGAAAQEQAAGAGGSGAEVGRGAAAQERGARAWPAGERGAAGGTLGGKGLGGGGWWARVRRSRV